jgi:hypothetical protein
LVHGFENRWDFLEVGSPVWHGVKFDGSTGLWRAVDVELYSFEELQSFRNEELPEPPHEESEPAAVAPEPTVVEHKSEMLRPENCRRTLMEIIQLRKNLCLSKL